MKARASLCALILISAVTVSAGQQEAPAETPQPVQRLDAWPVFKGTELSGVKRDIQRLRKARTEEMGSEAQSALIEAGAGVVPLLLPSLDREKDPDARERILGVLDALSGAAHTRLLGARFSDKAKGVRIWCLQRCARFPDSGLLKPAEAAWAAVTKQGKRADPEERYAAAVCAASAGSWASFDCVKETALKSWGKHGTEIRIALESIRGPQGIKRTRDLLTSEDRKRIVAGLNLLSGCGDESAISGVRTFLDNNDNSIRVAAINAMRGIVDGAPPVKNLPVFDAIEMAKEWKQRTK